MLKHNLTYEIMRPETVGVSQTRLVLGKHSGRHAFKNRLVEMGYEVDEEDLNKLFDRFKGLADKKKDITDADIEALVSDEMYQPQEVYHLDGLQVACGTMGMPTATVRLIGPDGQTHVHAEVGAGPIDAAYKAIDAVVGASNTLLEFSVHAITEGIDALGEVTVRIESEDGMTVTAQDNGNGSHEPTNFGGYGADSDIIVASVKSYLAAVNKLLLAKANHQLTNAN